MKTELLTRRLLHIHNIYRLMSMIINNNVYLNHEILHLLYDLSKIHNVSVKLNICVLNPIHMVAYFSFFQWDRFQSLVFNKTKIPSNGDTGDENDRHQHEDDDYKHRPVWIRDFLVRGLETKHRNKEMTPNHDLHSIEMAKKVYEVVIT